MYASQYCSHSYTLPLHDALPIFQVFDTLSVQPVGPGVRVNLFPFSTAALAPDGRTVLTGGTDKSGRIWDVETGQERAKVDHMTPVWTVDYHPEGQTFFTCRLEGGGRLTEQSSGAPECLL